MLVETFDLLAWGGVVEKLIGRRRDSPDGLNMEQPTEVPNDNSAAFQSLVNAIRQGICFSERRMTLK